jgi:hypothetical protein
MLLYSNCTLSNVRSSTAEGAVLGGVMIMLRPAGAAKTGLGPEASSDVWLAVAVDAAAAARVGAGPGPKPEAEAGTRDIIRRSS